MDVKIVNIKTEDIEGWESFHDAFQKSLGFPKFYGRNMDAWIDCMTYLDDSDSGMATVTVKLGGLVILKIENAAKFKERCLEQYEALIECSAFVNERRVEAGEEEILALMFVK